MKRERKRGEIRRGRENRGKTERLIEMYTTKGV